MSEKPNYYAIITADIRYDNRLTDSEKLLYGEITALSQSTGECWASNNYFAELYNVTTETISRRISKLRNLGYVDVVITYKGNTKQIDKRIIKIINTSPQNNQRGIDAKINRGIDANVKGNNTSMNNTSMNNIYSQVVSYLNDKAGRNYKVVNGNTKHIQARVNEGYTLEDFKKVIDNKCLDWLGTEWERYLQPSTLFGNKFDTYLNTIPTEKKSHNEFLDMLKRGEFDEY